MAEDEFTPVDRPLLLSDLTDIRRIVRNIESVQLQWYEESKKLTGRVSALERRVWLPAVISVIAAIVAVLARYGP